MFGAVSNASKLMELWPLNVMSCMTIHKPQKEEFKVAEEMKLPSLFSAHEALTWIQATVFPYPNLPLDPTPFYMVSSHQFTPAQPSWAQHWCSRVNSKQHLLWVWQRSVFTASQQTWAPHFLRISIITHLIPSRSQSLLSLGALLIAPNMTFYRGSVGPLV